MLEPFFLWAKKNNATLFMVLLSAYNTVLYRYSGQEDLVVGSPIAGRPHADLRYIVGMFVNTLAFRSYPQGTKTFEEFLAEVKDISLKAYENQDYQFEELVNKLEIARDMSRNPLFDTMFVLQNMDIFSDQLADIRILPFEYDNNVSKFDLTLTATEVQNRLVFNLQYCTRLFKQETMERFISHLINILEAVVRTPEARLAELAMLSSEEKNAMLVAYNASVATYPREKVLHQLFEEQVERTPDRVAIEFVAGVRHSTLTYQELNEKANMFAGELMRRDISKAQIVAILMDRSPEMLIGLLGVLKAGGAYLPIDLEYPVERIAYMLQDSEAVMLLSRRSLLETIWASCTEDTGIQFIDLDDESIYTGNGENPQRMVESRDLAYVIYTSGSTGRPKGVLIEHQGVVNYLSWAKKIYLEDKEYSMPLYSSLSFDLTVTSIYLPLISGNRVVIYGEAEKELLIEKILQDNRVQMIKLTPAHLQIIKELQIDQSSVKRLIVGGEDLKVELARAIYDKFDGNVEIFNEYGPTETVVGCMIHCYNPEVDVRSSVPIGVPADNMQIYLLDSNLQPVAHGVIGEIYIAGDGMARGYLKQPELTAEKFIANPFTAGKTMYKTGDLARRLPSGELEYLGRQDNQVKIRGYRIELGEIEAMLLQFAGVKEAIVTARKDREGDNYLCAYLVMEDLQESFAGAEQLRKLLPDYMVPSFFVILNQLPLTPNGKVDHRALPEPDCQMEKDVLVPRNIVEAKLLTIWQEVLGRKDFGVTDNFFELGGHSLKAIRTVMAVYREMHVEITLKDIFAMPTIVQLAGYINGKEAGMFTSIQLLEQREYYSASSAQKRTYVLYEFDRESISYNIPFFVMIEGLLDSERLETAVRKMIRRHEALRTTFKLVDGELVQLIHDQVEFALRAYEASEHELEAIAEDFIRPFDLKRAPLLRAGVVKVINQDSETQKYLLMVDMHHIISDGVSKDIFFRELVELYDKEDADLPTLTVQYKDFAEWQNCLFASAEMKKQEEYWLNLFAGEVPVLNLPTDSQRPTVMTFTGDRVNFKVTESLTEKLNEFAKGKGATLFMVLEACYNILLSKYSGQEDLVVGVPVAGRSHPDLENVLGMFTNTLAIRTQISGEQSFSEYLSAYRETAIKAFENQDYQFEMLVDQLNLERDTSRNPLFDTVFTMQNLEPEVEVLKDVKMYPYPYDFKIAKFDLRLAIAETRTGLAGDLEFNTRLFKRETAERMVSHYVRILEEVVADPEVKLAKIEMLSAGEKDVLLVGFNNLLSVNYPAEQTIHQIFSEQAGKTPERIAVVCGEQALTYRELELRSSQLALLLRAKGVGRDQIVGILADRSLDLIVAILGTLKAGGAYLSMDPQYPAERIRYMLHDSQTRIVVSQSHLDSDIQSIEYTGEMIFLDELDLELATGVTVENINQPEDLAYIIYTSGSTGKPKGVMVEHRNVVRLMFNDKFQFDFNETDVWTVFHSFSFDFSVWEMYGALLYGGKLVIVPRMVAQDTRQFLQLLRQEKVTVLNQTPTAFYHLIFEERQVVDADLHIRYVIFGGEALKPIMLKDWQSKYPWTKLINMYGITETTVHVTYKEITEEEIQSEVSNIGKPIPTLATYILNRCMQLVPVGVPGELCVGGKGVARGYLNRPELTSEKFVSNPYAPEEIIYRSGDLARVLPNGEMEYLGRIDRQVKIRGFRIELGEIERELLRIEGVQETVVVDYERSQGIAEDRYLCAYLVTIGEIDLNRVKEQLGRVLPGYMIPAYFVPVDRIPMTSNGKVDRKALPEPEMGSGKEYQAPRNEIEEKLVDIWREVLGLEEIGVADSFFDLGGHSLKATVLATKIAQSLQVEIPLRQIFETPTIQELARLIPGQEKVDYAAINRIEEREYYPVSSAQKRLYALHQINPTSLSYNMPLVFTVEEKIDSHAFQKALNDLLQRQEALRTSFTLVDGEVVQKIAPDLKVQIQYHKLQGEELSLETLVEDFVKPFNLSQAPLLRVELVETMEKNLLLLDMHHIISDAISQKVFFTEFTKLYAGEELAPMKIQYKDFANWQNQLHASDLMKKQEIYWHSVFTGEIPQLELPYDYSRSAVMTFDGDRIDFRLDETLTAALRDLAQENNVTLFMVMFAAYNVFLAKYSGQEDIIVGTPIAGRHHTEVENIIGMFVNTLALRNQPEGNKQFTAFLKEVKHHAVHAYENQDYQFEMLIESLGIERDISRNPLFDTCFSLQNKATEEMAQSAFRIRQQRHRFKIAKFDLLLILNEMNDGMFGDLEYNSRLFTAQTVAQMTVHFTNLLKAIVADPMTRISDLQVMSASEKEQLVVHFNETQNAYSDMIPIHQLFTAQALRTPERIAIVFEDQIVTYQELNKKADQLAGVLQSYGVSTNHLVGLMAERSPEAVVGMLGVLKAGGAYVPIDPEYPVERIQYILKDSGTNLLLSQNQLINRINLLELVDQIIDMNDAQLYAGKTPEVENVSGLDDLAYIIYTSGSTGRPKGAMIEHRGLVNYTLWGAKIYVREEECNFPLYSSLSFDLTVTSIYIPLITGNSMVIYGNEDRELLISRILLEDRVQVIKLTPAHLQVIKEMDLVSSQVKRFIVGGEDLKVELARAIYEKFEGNVEIYNEYGPTETVVGCMIYRYNPEKDSGLSVPIGHPADNVQIYLLDSYFQPVATGVVGEIFIAGEGVARGYLNMPELTRERFVENPFTLGTRMYRTGDLARRLPDGNLQFIDRRDGQVKVRGYRIELGEIESQIIKLDHVKEAIVIDRTGEDGSKSLCAYLVGVGEVKIPEIRDHLKMNLPEYMIPAHFVELDQIPLTLNGKIDRTALPEPGFDRKSGVEYIPPRSETEKILAQIWMEVLHVDKVGLYDSIFELGGDSIKAIQMLARANQRGIHLSIADIFKYKTIAALLANVDHTQEKASVSQDEVNGWVPFTPIQGWFFELGLKNPEYYYLSRLFALREDVDLERLEKSFTKLIEHHDALRMKYDFDSTEIVQYNRSSTEIDFALETIDLAEYEDQQQMDLLQAECQRVRENLSLTNDLLVKVAIFDLGRHGKRMLLAIHHLIVDGVSWRILLEDLQNLYESELEDNLPLKTTSFKEWSERLREYAEAEVLNLEYWNQIQLETIQPLVETQVKDNLVADHQQYVSALGEEETEHLLTRVNRAYNTTTDDVLLTALTMAMANTLGLEKLLITLEGHGREELFADVDLSRTVGWFTSEYPVCLLARDNIVDTLKSVKENLRQIPSKGLNYGIARYLQSNEQMQFINPEIAFNYLGQFDVLPEQTTEDELIFKICPETSGQDSHPANRATHLFGLNAIVVGGKLHIALDYNEKYLSKQTVETLGESYKQYLLELINHCIEQKESIYTPADFGLQNHLDLHDLDKLTDLVDVRNVQIYPLTPVQEGILFHTLLAEEGMTYSVQLCFMMKGDFQIEYFNQAWQMLTDRHEIYRTSFIWEMIKKPVQIIHKEKQAELYQYDLSELSGEEQYEHLEWYKNADLAKGFDFAAGRLSRMSLFKLAERSFFICWTFHHIISDGWSTSKVISDLFQIYASLTGRRSLSEQKGQFSDYLQWLQKQNYQKGMNFWEKYMADFAGVTQLPLRKREKREEGISHVQTYEFILSRAETEVVQQLCREQQITVNTLFQTAWGIVLQKYNRTDQSCAGMTVSGRTPELNHVEEIVGIFINTIPVLIQREDGQRVWELLQNVNDSFIEMREYDYVPLAEIQKLAGGGELFDSIVVFENYPVNQALGALNLDLRLTLESTYELSNYDLTLLITAAEEITFKMNYNAELFSQEMMTNLGKHFLTVLMSMVENPDADLSTLSIISVEEKDQLIHFMNNTRAEYPATRTLNQLFDAQTIKTPDAVAVIFADQVLTYQELNQKADQLAAVLRNRGVGNESLVGICLPRSLEMMVGIMGILKAGGAYVPVDPLYPVSRIQYMLKDSNLDIMITDGKVMFTDQFDIEFLDVTDRQIYGDQTLECEPVNRPDSLAYVIYTSGSTGQPKGVMIEHHSVVNRLYWMQKQYPLTTEDVILQKTPVTFDVSVWELFWWALVGAKVCLLAPGGEKNPETIVETIEKHEVTTMHFVPSMLNAFMEYVESVNVVTSLSTLRKVFASGEALNVLQVQRFNRLLNQSLGTSLHNLYGPTEATVDVTYFDCTPWEETWKTVPIGSPIDNTQIYILDSDNQLLPPGIPGELCIAGVGVARGYLNNPELTAEKFKPNPFNPCEKLYHTGDLACWRTDGVIEYLGRLDYQVKIRGFRIELGEIETHLLRFPAVKEALVVTRGDEIHEYLCAYIVATEEIVIGDLKEYLSLHLPEYMIPAYFVQLAEMPLTPNGKIDRKQLPDNEVSAHSQYYQGARNQLEEVMVKIWQEVLGVKTIGIRDNFFELTGDSIKAIQILSRATQHGIPLRLKDIFQYRTIAATAEQIENRERVQAISQEEIHGEIVLTPIQHWFFDQQMPDLHYFNQTNLFRLPANVDLKLLEEAFKQLIKHHDALRICYDQDGNRWVSRNRGSSEVNFALMYEDLTGFPAEERGAKLKEMSETLQQQLNLHDDLLIKAVVFDLGDAGKRLLIPVHHLIVDGISWRILLEDLQNLYHSRLRDPLPWKTTSYQEWANRLQYFAEHEEMDLSYWEKIHQEQIVSLTQEQVRCKTVADYQRLQVKLSLADTQELLTRANRAYQTGIDDLLLSALTLAFTETMHTDHLFLTMEGHGREEIFADLDLTRTIGWFTSEYPVFLRRQSNPGQMIKHVKENLRQIPNKGVNFGIARYLQGNQRLCELNPEIVYNYLGQIDRLSIDHGTEGSLLMTCSEDSGLASSVNNQILHLLNISGMVFEGQLVMNFSYHSRYLSEECMKHLQDQFQSILLEIIQHCVDHERTIYTPSDFALEKILDIEDFDYVSEIADLSVEKVYALTPVQEGILFHSLYNEESKNYYIQMAFEVEGELNTDYLEQAWHELIQRHDIFKTRFVWKQIQKPVQIIAASGQADFNVLEIQNVTQIEKVRYLEQFPLDDLERPFDFADGKLTRLTVIKTGEKQYMVYWTLHHIISDGWSLSIAVAELFNLYATLAAGQRVPANPEGQFRDYLDWLQRKRTGKGLRVWKEYLKEFSEPSILPIKQTSQGRKAQFVSSEELLLNEAMTKVIHEFCVKHNITMNTFIQIAWGILLQKYSNTDTSCAGMTVSGRPHDLKNVETMTGLFINTIPVLIKTEEETTIHELIETVQQDLLEIREYEHIPLTEIKQLVSSSGELFDSIVVFENYPVNEALLERADQALQIKVKSVFEMNNYDLTLIILQNLTTTIRFSYQSSSFTPDTICRMSNHLLKVIETMLIQPEARVRDVCILTEDEQTQLLGVLNHLETVYPAQKTIHQLFSEQVQRTPEHIAVVCGEKQMTYRELELRANQLAQILRLNGVGQEQIVGILLERSSDVIVAILGTLKAGGAYLCIDPQYPNDRISFMLNDSQTSIMLSHSKFDTDLQSIEYTGEVIFFNELDFAQIPGVQVANLSQPSDLAYIIYTSGSTGKPKGVMVEHRNVVRLMFNDKFQFEFSESDVWTVFHSFSFDFSVWEMYGALLYGGKLVVVPEMIAKDTRQFLHLLSLERVTVLNQTPSAFYNLIFAEMQETNLDLHLRYVIFGGEALKPMMLKEWRAKYPASKLINMYGITETTVHVTYKEITEKEIETNVSNIGKPIPTLALYVLDRNMALVPVGVPGELCVGGEGVARGYLNSSALTAEKFIPNPYRPTEIIYRSGDLARVLPDGELEYLGRIDRQVKIRGFRIELGEIEKELLNLRDIEEAVVVDFERNQEGMKDNYLCAYLVASRELNIQWLKEQLAQALPGYMIPAYFVKLDQIPMTSNGKVDRKALPKPESGHAMEFQAPRNEIEAKMVGIWKEVLGIEEIGMMDNFFDLGGHSLKVTFLAARILKAFEVEIPLKQIFDTPTVQELAQFIENQEKTRYRAIIPVEKREYYPVSSAQKRIFLTREVEGDSTVYNMPVLMEIEGDVDLNHLHRTLDALITRHESLRTSFVKINGAVVQRVQENIGVEIHVLEASETQIESLAHDFVQPFDLSQAPLLRVSFIKTGLAKGILMVDMHHIISDGISSTLLFREFSRLYNGDELPQLRLQYKDFAVWQNNLLDAEEFIQQENYWLAQFASEVPDLNLPLDYPRSLAIDSRGDCIFFDLDLDLTEKLKQIAEENKSTLFMVLLAVYNILLAKYSRQTDITVGIMTAGRPHPDLLNLIGMFINPLPVRNHVEAKQSFSEFLQMVKETTLGAYENQDYPFEMLVSKLNVKRQMNRQPLFDVIFYLNNFADGTVFAESVGTLKMSPYPLNVNQIAKFDLSLGGYESSDGLNFNCEYRTSLFKRETMMDLVEKFKYILKQVTENQKILVEDIRIILAQEEAALAKQINIQELSDDFNF